MRRGAQRWIAVLLMLVFVLGLLPGGIRKADAVELEELREEQQLVTDAAAPVEEETEQPEEEPEPIEDPAAVVESVPAQDADATVNTDDDTDEPDDTADADDATESETAETADDDNQEEAQPETADEDSAPVVSETVEQPSTPAEDVTVEPTENEAPAETEHKLVFTTEEIEEELPELEEVTEEIAALAADEEDENPEDVTTASFFASVTNSVNGVETELTEAGATVTTSETNQNFALNIEAVWPANSTDHQIKINAGYGLAWGSGMNGAFSFDSLDKSEIWYTGLKSDGFIAPSSQADASDKPMSWAGVNFRNGTLTLNYKDSISRVNIVGSTGGKLQLYSYINNSFNLIGSVGIPTLNKAITGSDPITVTFSYTDKDGVFHSVEKKLTELNYTNNPPSKISTGVKQNRALVENGYYIVRPDGTLRDDDVTWTFSYAGATPIWLVDDAFFVIELPRYVVMSDLKYEANLAGRNNGHFNTDIRLENGAVLPDGSELELADPENNIGILVDFDAGARGLTYTYGGTNGTDMNLKFPLEFYEPDTETVYTVRFAAAGAKIHYSDEWITMKDNPGANYAEIKILIQSPQEDVYVNTSATSTAHEGATGGNTYSSNEGIDILNEGVAGAFYIGNRGTGDSVTKTVELEYGVTNGSYVGITQQNLFTSYTMANLSCWIWNPETGETQKADLTEAEAAALIKKGFVHIDDLSAPEGWYIKKIQFDISTIPNRSTASGTTRRDFYGVQLKVPESNLISKNVIRIWDADKSFDRSDADTRSYEGTVNTTVHADRFYPTFDVTGGGTYTSGQNAAFTFEIGNIHNAAYGPYNAVLTDKIYLISPYGEEYTDITVSYLAAKSASGATTTTTQPVITELPEAQLATLREKSGYENARVWQLDFSQMTAYPDKLNRLLGLTTGTSDTARDVVYGAISGSVTNKAYITISANMKLNPDDPLGSATSDIGGLVWVKPLLPTNGDGSDNTTNITFSPKKYNIPNTFSSDINGLTGFASTQMIPGGTMDIVGASKIVATSSMKRADEADAMYRSWDGENDASLAEAVLNDTDYRITLFNSSTQPANEGTVYFPIPKQGENWNGTVINMSPEGAFGFDMELAGPGVVTVGDGYSIQYASVDTPSANKNDWSGYDWKAEGDVTDWSQINFVKITKIGVPAQDRATVNFTLKSSFTEEDISNKARNVFAPLVISDTSAGTVEEMGNPVGAYLLPATISGVVWHDASEDGIRDEDEELSEGITITLYKADGKTVIDTAVTDKNGAYEIKTPVYTASTVLKIFMPDENTHITVNENDSVFSSDHTVTLPKLTAYENPGYDCGLTSATISAKNIRIHVGDSEDIQLKIDGAPANHFEITGIVKADDADDIVMIDLKGNEAVGLKSGTQIYQVTARNIVVGYDINTAIDVTVYAHVIYDGNRADVGDVPVDGNEYVPEDDDTVTVAAQGDMDKTGYLFRGWMAEGGTIYQEGDTFEIGAVTEDVTLTAQWALYTVDLLKVDGDYNAVKLAGAEFALYSADYKNELGEVDKSAKPIMTVTTDRKGLSALGELLLGTYYLVETKAPDGYNLLTAPVELELTKDNVKVNGVVIEPEQESDLAYTVTVTNAAGTELPDVGGVGTTIFYMIGGLLVVCAAAWLVIEKQKRRNGTCE